jgi:tetratricopeptide (TPR) repeat protein
MTLMTLMTLMTVKAVMAEDATTGGVTMTENFKTTENFNAYRPDGEPAVDRWLTALHLFDEPRAGAPGEQNAAAEDGAEPDIAEAWQRALLLFEDRDYVAAVKLLVPVVGAMPRQVAPRLLLARAYYHSAQLRRAEEQLRTVIELDPVEHYAYLMLGRTLERQARHAEAAPWLRAASAFAGELDAVL